MILFRFFHFQELEPFLYKNFVYPKPHHIQSIIQLENDNTDLLVTVGGDGTFGDAIQGFQCCEQNALYSHIPTGTSNGVCMNFHLSPSPVCSAMLILEGSEKPIDVVSVNIRLDKNRCATVLRDCQN